MKKITKHKSKTQRKAAKRVAKRTPKAPQPVRMSVRIPASVAAICAELERETNAPFSAVLITAAGVALKDMRDTIKARLIGMMEARAGELS